MAASTTFYRRTGARLRMFRLRAGLSQAALGERLGVTAGAINRYEMGGRRVPLGDVPRIAAILGIAAAELFGEAAAHGGAVREESPMYGRRGRIRQDTAAHTYAGSVPAARLRALAKRAGLRPAPEPASLRRYAELIAEDFATQTRRKGGRPKYGGRRVRRGTVR